MFSRPKPGESEDDLLKFQKEFLANQTKASAAVVQRGDKRKSEKYGEDGKETKRDIVQMDVLPPEIPKEEQPVKKSKFRQSQEQRTKPLVDTAFDPEEEIDKHDTHMEAVLTKIIERDTRNVQVSLPNPCTDGFPKVLHLDQQNQTQTFAKPGKKKSLFAQQFSSTGVKDFGLMVQQETSRSSGSGEPEEMDIMEEVKIEGEGPHLIEGIGLSATFGKDEAIKIHEENVQKLQSMHESEIAEEQRKLLEILDPKLVAFLRKKKVHDKEDKNQMLISTEAEEAGGTKVHGTKLKTKLEEKDFPIKPKKEWAHMERLEYDKLEWMKDLPAPSTDNKETGQHARFDFQGNLITGETDVPVNIGLHHHGNEPERPGYTLEELFHLARSTNNQQRTLALQTLSNILKKVRNGELEALVQSPVLPALIDAGVMFLLRWALDDTVEMVVSATVSALCNLLVSDADENSLDQVFCWNQGHSAPKHQPRSEEDDNMKSPINADETPQETDADVLKRDVILCLVTRMNFLPRLRYILTKTRPQAPTIINILKILCRVVHHSPKVAYNIFQCQGLLDVILQEFLPTSWNIEDLGQPLSDIYGMPVTIAMRLMRCLAQAGRNMASILLTDNQLQARLLRYMVEVNPASLNLPELEAFRLQTESYRTWKVCLLYGLATEIYIDMFPAIIDKLRHLEENIVSESVTDYQIENFVEFIGALEAVVHVAGTNSSKQAKFKRSQEGQSMEVEGSEFVAMPTINWGHVADLLHPVARSLSKVMNYIKDNYQFKKIGLNCATACLNFMTSYYSRLVNQVGQDTVQYLQQIETYCQEILLPCWKSIGFRVILERLSKFSNILNSPEEKPRECVCSLPALGGSSVKEEQLLPVVCKGSPYGFLTSILRQIYTLCQIHKGIQDKILPLVITDADIVSYMKKVAACKPGYLHSNYFTRFENLLQFYYLKLAVLLDDKIIHLYDPAVLQCLTLKLLTRLHYGDEYLAHDLFSTVVFRRAFWSKPSEEEALSSLENMKLSEVTHLHSATQEEISFTCTQLTAAARSCLLGIRATYIKTFSYFEKEAYHSRNVFHQNPHEVNTFLSSSTEEFLLPNDWMYMPLVYLYNHFSSVGTEVQNALSVMETETMSNVLKWIFLLERDQPALMSSISITLKISRLMCTFLTGNDLFLDRTVHSYLAAFLREYTKPQYLDQMNFEESIPGLLSFYDFYITVLHQFEAVSFGDSVFGCYILIPLQQKHGLELRRSIWTEQRGILRTLYLPIREMLIPIERYLHPEETNVEMIRLYYECLLSLHVRPRWAPVLYIVAVHHVNRFIYTQDNKHTKLKQAMLKEVLKGRNKDLSHHLLYYKQADVSHNMGMEFYTTLPLIRQQLIDRVAD